MIRKAIAKPDEEYIKVEMTIEKIFDGSSMRYEVVGGDFLHLSEKFKKVLREDWEIDVDEYTALVAIEETVVDLEEERILFDT